MYSKESDRNGLVNSLLNNFAKAPRSVTKRHYSVYKKVLEEACPPLTPSPLLSKPFGGLLYFRKVKLLKKWD